MTLPVVVAQPLEVWVAIAGHEGQYEVSSIGRVRGVERLNSRGYRQPAKTLKAPIDDTGYRVVNLCRNGVGAKHRVHVLVCEAFNGNRPEVEHPQVRHLDGDQLNNFADNLTWGSYTDQRQDDIRNGVNWQTSKTHCPEKHEYSIENTYSPPSRPRSRYCRKCARNRRGAPVTA